MSNKTKVVVSGVNITEGGALNTFQHIVDEIINYPDIELICIVNTRKLFAADKYNEVKFIEYPEVKKRWLRRLYFEYFKCIGISKKILPDIWISMHDITPAVVCKNKFVYCHNPSPFYKSSFFDLKKDPSFFLFTLLYKYLYKINIKKNLAVIVQQDWLARSFTEWYGVNNIIVAKPERILMREDEGAEEIKKCLTNFTYPALARTFKNFELICYALEILKNKNKKAYSKIKVNLTISGNENKYSKFIFEKYSHLDALNFLGKLSREQMDSIYRHTDVVLFPSKLETWGLPISEAKANNLPIIVADLPYAKETIGDYDKLAFIDVNDAERLSKMFEQCVEGQMEFGRYSYKKNKDYEHCDSWRSLVNTIFKISEI